MKLNLTILAATLVLSSCSSTLHRGIIAMKLDEHTAHIGLNSKEVNVGDHVELYENKCTKPSKSASSNTPSCQKIHKGHGLVTKVIGEDYSEVKFDDGVIFEEGNFIEKHSH